MRWVEVVDVEPVVEAVAAPAVAAAQDEVAARGRDAWEAPLRPGQVVIASAPTAGAGSRTRRACPATRPSALSAARK